MQELIDKEKVQTEIALIAKCLAKSDAQKAIIGRILFMIDNMHTIEPEVRHGRWILCEDQHGVDNDNNNYAYFCSQCHYQDVHSKYAKVNFCWNCGADMSEVSEDAGID